MASAKDVLRGIGAGLQSVGTGMVQLDEQRYQRERDAKLLAFQERQVKVAEETLATQKEWQRFNAEYMMKQGQEQFRQFNVTQENTKAEKDLDRVLQRELATQREVHEFLLESKRLENSKEMEKIRDGIEQQLIARRGVVNVIAHARAVGLNILGEEGKMLTTYMAAPPPDPSDEKAFAQWKNNYKFASERMVEIQQEIEARGRASIDDPIKMPVPKGPPVVDSPVPQDVLNKLSTLPVKDQEEFLQLQVQQGKITLGDVDTARQLLMRIAIMNAMPDRTVPQDALMGVPGAGGLANPFSAVQRMRQTVQTQRGQ